MGLSAYDVKRLIFAMGVTAVTAAGAGITWALHKQPQGTDNTPQDRIQFTPSAKYLAQREALGCDQSGQTEKKQSSKKSPVGTKSPTILRYSAVGSELPMSKYYYTDLDSKRILSSKRYDIVHSYVRAWQNNSKAADVGFLIEVGKTEYNPPLSRIRAEALRDEFIKEGGIPPERLCVKWDSKNNAGRASVVTYVISSDVTSGEPTP